MKFSRIAEITKIFAEEGLGYLVNRNEVQDESLNVTSDIGARLRRTLERLGPTFVKFGQLLATRVDLFGEDFLNEMGKLHAEVAAFSNKEAMEIISKELERPVDEIFSDFSESPVASASIAQVYKAKLKENGQYVAIKVQRPGLETSLVVDLEVLLTLSQWIDRLVPPYHRSMVHRLALEYVHRARGELDFLAEGRAIDQFSVVLKSAPEFDLPTVYHSLSTPKLLVLEWFDGPKLGELKDPSLFEKYGHNPDLFGKALLRLQLCMSYEYGFVHGDTHPGNIILRPGGRIGLIDFGLHGHVPRKIREKMLETLFYQSQGNVDQAINCFVAIFQLESGTNLKALKEAMRPIFSKAANATTLEEDKITSQLIKGMRVGARFQLRAQSDLFLVIRNLTIVEGILLRFCPGIDPMAEIKTITSDIMRRMVFGSSMQEEITQLIPHILLTISKRPQLAERLLRLERTFTDSKSLGDFLRQEEVIKDHTPAKFNWLVGAGLIILGLIIGFLIPQ